ncbi:MAG TPA: ABC transporter permease [Egibacteraceae bacterium]|nr:ABC transporter permease [Egibacteraceae bacterium]
MSPLWQWWIRVSAFLRKELVAIVRQPSLVLALVLGPFLVLLLFGAGLQDADPPLRTVFVAPEDSRIAEEVRSYAETQRSRLEVVGVSDDEDAMVRQLRRGELELVVVFPEEAAETVRGNDQAEITLYHNELDPVETQAIALFMRTAVDQINQRVLRIGVEQVQVAAGNAHEGIAAARTRATALRQAVDGGDSAETSRQQGLLAEDMSGLALALAPAAALLGDDAGDGRGANLIQALDAVSQRSGDLAQSQDPQGADIDEFEADLARLDEGLEAFRSMDPGIIVAPFRGETQSIAREVDLSDFYAPAVVALLLQHMVITFLGLSVVREEELGTFDLFRVAPLSPTETLIGKVLAYLLLDWAVAVCLIALLVLGLGVPMAGSWGVLALGITAVLLASIGVGFVVALLARSDSQAVQYAMLLLLASVFFSGFLLSLERFRPVLRPVSWILPVTWGTRLLRDVMLRGEVGVYLPIVALGLIAMASLATAMVLLRRRMLRA